MWEVSARVHPAKGRTLEVFQRHGFIRRTSFTDREESDSQAGRSRDEGQQDHEHPGTGETAGGFQSLEPVSTACQEGLPSGAGQGGCRAQQCPTEDVIPSLPSPMPVPPLAHPQAGAMASLPRVEWGGEQGLEPPGQEMPAAGPGAGVGGTRQQTWARGAAPPSLGSQLPQGPDGGGRC